MTENISIGRYGRVDNRLLGGCHEKGDLKY